MDERGWYHKPRRRPRKQERIDMNLAPRMMGEYTLMAGQTFYEIFALVLGDTENGSMQEMQGSHNICEDGERQDSAV